MLFQLLNIYNIFINMIKNFFILRGVQAFHFRKMISSLELEGTARTRPDILKVVLGQYVQYCLREASEQKPESELKVIELSYCHHSMCR